MFTLKNLAHKGLNMDKHDKLLGPWEMWEPGAQGPENPILSKIGEFVPYFYIVAGPWKFTGQA